MGYSVEIEFCDVKIKKSNEQKAVEALVVYAEDYGDDGWIGKMKRSLRF